MMRLSVQKSIIDRGYMTISIWVLDQNDRAKSFYKRNGFKADGDVKNSGLGGGTHKKKGIFVS